MSQWICMLMLCVVAAVSWPAHAQSIYKCRDSVGGTVYQSSPCLDGKAEERRWETTAEPASSTEDRKRRSEAEASIERARQSVRASNARSSKTRRATGAGIRGRDPKACDAARARREATLKRLGLKRTYAQIQQLDEAVFTACQ